MELFISTVPYERICPALAPVRNAAREISKSCWTRLGFEPTILDCGEMRSLKTWQRDRRMYADCRSKGDYILADDDLIALDDFTVDRCADLMEQYPQFAILAAYPVNENIRPWTPEGYQPVNDENVMEHVSVGGINICRKGAMKEWPPMGNTSGYDGIQGEYLRSQGWRVGYAKQLGCVHLGKGLSSLQ